MQLVGCPLNGYPQNPSVQVGGTASWAPVQFGFAFSMCALLNPPSTAPPGETVDKNSVSGDGT